MYLYDNFLAVARFVDAGIVSKPSTKFAVPERLIVHSGQYITPVRAMFSLGEVLATQMVVIMMAIVAKVINIPASSSTSITNSFQSIHLPDDLESQKREQWPFCGQIVVRRVSGGGLPH
jgi:hypothetical protein